MTVANALTLMRILLVPVFLYCFVEGDRKGAFIVFCVAAGTDLIDGTVARLMNQSSRWGAILDPMADKLMFVSVFICMVISGVIPLWFFVLALARDIMIVCGLMYLKINKIPHPQFAITSSKFATLLQMGVAVTGLLMYWNPKGAFDQYFGAQVPFLVLATNCIIISGVQYVCRGLEILKNYHPVSANS